MNQLDILYNLRRFVRNKQKRARTFLKVLTPSRPIGYDERVRGQLQMLHSLDTEISKYIKKEKSET